MPHCSRIESHPPPSVSPDAGSNSAVFSSRDAVFAVQESPSFSS